MEYLTKDNPINSHDFGPLPPHLDRRGIAEEETRRDLAKSYAQLLADAHHEMTDPHNDSATKVGFATRRIAGITTQAALAMATATKESSAATAENIKLQTEVRTLNRRLLWLTIIILAFTVVGAVSGVFQAYYARASYNLSLRQSQERLLSPMPQLTK